MPDKIFKYQPEAPIAAGEPFTLKMPDGARVVHVAEQNNLLTVWAIVDERGAVKERRFAIYGTGQDIAPNAEHFQTFIRGPYVWHVFELL